MGRVLAALVAVAIACAGCGAGPPSVRSDGEGDDEAARADAARPGPPELPVPGATYVGPEACADCHRSIARTYARTGMGRAFYPMSPAVAVEDFAVDNVFAVPGTPLRYRMERRGDRFFQVQYTRTSSGAEVGIAEREIHWVLGSNNHSRSYLTDEDGELFQLPVCWYPEARLWDLCPGYEHRNHHFRRPATTSCVFCHNGRMVPIEGEVGAYVEPLPHGIGCERCHGPGSRHVARWREASEPATGAPDPTIVNPRRLPKHERIEVCFQCHLGDSKATERVGRLGRDLLDFRPGQRLSAYMAPFHYRDPTRHDFGLSAQADRLVQSACFKESGGAIECLTCHDPHLSVYAPDQAPDRFDRRCRACHASESACSGPLEARRATEPPDHCVGCHMRSAEPDDQRYTTFTDHWIRRRIDEPVRDVRASLEIEPVLPDAFEALPAHERALYRGRARLMLSLNTDDPRRKGMWEAAARDLEQATRGPGGALADPWFHLARAREYLGDRRGRIDALRRAIEVEPRHRDARFELGAALLAVGRVAEAATQFERLVDDDPDDAGALAELGRCRAESGRIAEAVSLYARAAEANPRDGEIRANLAMVLAASGRFEQALAAAERAVALDPEHAVGWETYGRLLEHLGRTAEGRELQRLGVFWAGR